MRQHNLWLLGFCINGDAMLPVLMARTGHEAILKKIAWAVPLRFFGGNAQLVSHSRQLNQRGRSHLAHDLAAMDLYRHVT